MKQDTSESTLLALYEELTDFQILDDASSSYRRKSETEHHYDRYSFYEDDVRTCLQDGQLFDFSGVTEAQPSSVKKEARDFASLFLRLVEARTERFFRGHTKDFDELLEHAEKLVPEKSTPITTTTVTPEQVEPYLLSQAWTDFVKDKGYDTTSGKGREFQKHYAFMVALWGDVDVATITKRTLRESLSRYAQLPKANQGRFHRKSIEELLKIPVEDIQPNQQIKASTAEGYLKLLQSFFNAFLYKKNDVYDRSITEGLSIEVDDCRYAAYSSEEIKKLENHVISEESQYKKWSILLAIYTGARLAEISSFLKDGARKDEATGIHYFFVEKGKTHNATRVIPIHPRLIELGVLDLPPIEAKENTIYRHLSKILKSLGIPKQDEDGYDKVFHSFRHSFITQAITQGLSKELVQVVVGHSRNLGITDRYVHTKPLDQLELLKNEVIDKINFN
ncbi:tyrosine-type recombinase/integrase [Photobacterium salinisoli]|uniref:tyrosine-type recombinase/integrase n=1 Tax=Photobacterium salinisoli TaxID=1616783 RepID=UPI0013C3E4A7|nr:tyrosine-type recombinase/integrase [Photobacterium salinisoli]